MASKINEYAAQWWADRLDDQHAEKREAFRQAILERIPGGADWRLKVGYDPWDELLEAVRAVGIGCSGFFWSAKGILPEKTCVIRCGNELRFKDGYGNWLDPKTFTEAECSDYP